MELCCYNNLHSSGTRLQASGNCSRSYGYKSISEVMLGNKAWPPPVFQFKVSDGLAVKSVSFFLDLVCAFFKLLPQKLETVFCVKYHDMLHQDFP